MLKISFLDYSVRLMAFLFSNVFDVQKVLK